jgi:outer membrane immunogenic protein
MIRRIFLASASALALAGTAFAADLPTQAPPPVFLPPPPMWTGFYAGINAGGTWSASNSLNTSAIPGGCNPAFPGCAASPTFSVTSAVLATFSAPSSSNAGFIGGGQIGYNYQFANSWVVGIEADIDGVAGAHKSVNFSNSLANPNFVATDLVTQTAFVSKSINYLGTVRGRFGYLITPTLLIFGDGGLAYGGINSSTGIIQGDTVDPGLPFNYFSVGRVSNTKVGWTAGGGAEWMFLPNWSAKVEYLYYDLGSVNYQLSPLVNIGGPGSAAPGSIFSSAFPRSATRFNGNVVRAGINYHFNWGAAPVVAKY